MEYVCRVGLACKTRTFRLTDQTLDVLTQDRVVERQVPYSEIKRFHQYAGFAVRDPDTGPYDSEYCRVQLRHGKSVDFRNGTYISPAGKVGEVVVNQNEEYIVFLKELKRRVCEVNPNVKVARGWLLALLSGWALGLLGIGFIAFAIGGFVMDKFLTALGIAAFCLPSAFVLLMMAIGYTQMYWPSQRALSKDLED